MRIETFRTYLNKTNYRGVNSVPDNEELRKMERLCIDELRQRRAKNYYSGCMEVLNEYFPTILFRISVCISQIEQFLPPAEQTAFIQLLSSFNRLMNGMKREYSMIKYIEQREHDTPSSSTSTKTAIERQPQLMVSSSSRYVPHFSTLKIDEEKAATLYDRLVQDGCLEDRSKKEFVFYYTGKGRKPVYQLKWRGDDILLSVLMEQLSPKGGRISWQVLGKIYEGLNTDSMKNVLSKTKKGEVVYTYEAHKKTVEEWLK